MASQKGGGAAATSAPPSWLRNVAVWVGGVLALAVVVVLGVAVLPGWWAAMVGDWVQGVGGRGIPIGLGVGALFTLLPLGVGLLATRPRLTSKARIVLIVIALLLLLPNVLTIAIAIGRSDARSMIAIAAPGFRGGSWAGMAAVVVAVVAFVVIRARSRRTRATLAEASDKAAQVAREHAEEVEAAQQVESGTAVEAPLLSPPGATTETPEHEGPEPRAH